MRFIIAVAQHMDTSMPPIGSFFSQNNTDIDDILRDMESTEHDGVIVNPASTTRKVCGEN